MPAKNVNNMTFAEAAAAWYETADKYADFGASDTEPRAAFAEVVERLAQGKDPQVPTKAYAYGSAEAWSLYSTMKGSFFAGKALTRSAERVVKVAERVGIEEVRAYASAQGWYF